jgi:penicillin-binding protein 2
MVKLHRRRSGIKYDQRGKDIDPDEILLDSSNLPNFDTHQFEGRLEKPISRRSLFVLTGFFALIIFIFTGRVWFLQVSNGSSYLEISKDNYLRKSLLFAKRGVISDRTGEKLAWNVENPNNDAFNLRKYTLLEGFSHLLGYLKYPSKDTSGFYFSEVIDGKAGVEKTYNNVLSGKNGNRIVEVDALGNVKLENIVQKTKDGDDIVLSIDASVQNKMYEEMRFLSEKVGYSGGAGVIMDINTGEILALTNYPEYDSQIMTDGQDTAMINKYINDKKNTPLLNRVISGTYTPGSTVKSFIAYAALAENIIDPLTNILSTEYLSIPNPYDANRPTIFRDWKVHGYVDMRKALAVSSDIYFYTVGGGFQDQKGLGIINIDKYMKMFGFGEPLKSSFFSGAGGVIPTPEWKAETFPEDKDWRIGNTYHTSIGQYGFLISPIQMVRAIAALVNGGKLLEPEILLNSSAPSFVDLKLNPTYLKVVTEGMRDGVIKDYGTVKVLNSANYTVAAKTGTAELGVHKQFVNSWVTGYFPYENPKYAFAVIMEKGPADNTMSATFIMKGVLDFIAANKPEYLK